MIKKEEKQELKKYLKGNYVKHVILILKNWGVVNRSGDSYSPSMIRRVFNGYTENKKIEDAILEAYQNSKKESDSRKRKKRKILGLDE